MNTITVSPTRLQRQQQIARHKTARRGHKLLKDKQDEMVRRLNELSRDRDELRDTVNQEIARAMGHFVSAKVRMSPTEIDNAVAAYRTEFALITNTHNIMGLIVPKLETTAPATESNVTLQTTPQNFDRAVATLHAVMPKLVELAGTYKTCAMLEHQIATLRRRINALEHMVIPQIQHNIHYITLKLSENERGNLVRMMKVKEIIADRDGD